MLTKILQILGLRSQCCGAKIETWYIGKYYCQKCEAWLGKLKTLETATIKPSMMLTPNHMRLKRSK
ncbi:MAG: hypothetical protein NVSMB46_06300 [Candidatus Saccharimonadales bacterium]